MCVSDYTGCRNFSIVDLMGERVVVFGCAERMKLFHFMHVCTCTNVSFYT